MDAFNYTDHIGLWQDELRPWMPKRVFDAHVHLGPAHAAGPLSPKRALETCTTFSSLSYELLTETYSQLYSGVTIEGLIAFGFPMREIDITVANRYIESIASAHPDITGFIISDPHDTPKTIAEYRAAKKRGFHFKGVKPYFDLVGHDIPRSNFHTRTSEFVPDDLLEFMEAEHLAMMLHTGLGGMGDPDCQDFVRKIAEKFPNICVFLAHMGRYTHHSEYEAFNASDLLDYPNVFVEVSSASEPLVYHAFFARRERWSKLIFGSDLPFGLITGVEYTEGEEQALFLSRDDYPWTNPETAARYARQRELMTYNTYHTIKAIKTAVSALQLSEAEEAELKERIFLGNARDCRKRYFPE